MQEQSESFALGKEQCPECAAVGDDTSGDNLIRYSDGHGYCFACGYYEHGNGEAVVKERKKLEFKYLSGEYVDMGPRRLGDDIVKKYGYKVGDHEIYGKVHIADYYSNGEVVAQHYRGHNKDFKWAGSTQRLELFGQHLWKNTKGKRLVITEGEIDAMSVCQALGGTWPVVSVPSGAQSAVKYVLQNLEFVDSYNEVVLCFDMDKEGQAAAVAVAEKLKPGKCRIASLPEKDANACLVANKSKALVNAVYEAKVFSPDEILHVSEVIDMTEEDDQREVWPFPWDKTTEFLLGQRSHEVSLWCSGTGSGKSTILRQIASGHLEEGRSVGMIMLEESPQETMDDMISLILKKPVRAIRANRMLNKLRTKMGKEPITVDIIDDLTDEEYAEAQKQLGNTGLYIYDHLGNTGMSCLMARMEYMAVSLGVDVILLDHITAAAAGLMGVADKDFAGGGAERLIIDNMMKEMRSLAVRTGVHIDIVSQLKKTDKAYEEGARITLQDLRGSGALASVPNTVIALERNRQAPDPKESNTTVVRVLKNRLTGRAGVASALFYDHTEATLKEIDFAMDNDRVIFEPQFEAVEGDPFV